ncbi:putative TM2 multi-domain protein [Nitrosotalea sinensis]|uniref:Putative TM2 multi-domain protein n=1 Tax=Nitrosotalea sinensis TaxID=1499975 RepID=A0A2H1EEV0_9ARCH|nr:SHOCT domain-containing protein [Candidatus Nitrosotalea sinensis]SHO43466.1 putative TM2 multi-domain protein [Candidatus Nitrosotalea sinensis]
MFEELIKQAEKLLDMNVGDNLRLTSIIERLKKGNDLYLSDQKYLDDLISKYLFLTEELDEQASNIQTSHSNDDAISILRERLARGEITIDEFNTLQKTLDASESEKSKDMLKEITEKLNKVQEEQNVQETIQSEGLNQNTALVLSLVLGLIGLQGIGHIYAGKIGTGIAYLIFSLILFASGWSLVLSPGGVLAPIGYFIFLVYLMMFIFQIIGARRACYEYNLEIYRKSKYSINKSADSNKLTSSKKKRF